MSSRDVDGLGRVYNSTLISPEEVETLEGAGVPLRCWDCILMRARARQLHVTQLTDEEPQDAAGSGENADASWTLYRASIIGDLVRLPQRCLGTQAEQSGIPGPCQSPDR